MGSFVLVDVKPLEMPTEPKVSDRPDWCSRRCTARGWTDKVWSGGNPSCVGWRYLAAGCRRWEHDDSFLARSPRRPLPA